MDELYIAVVIPVFRFLSVLSLVLVSPLIMCESYGSLHCQNSVCFNIYCIDPFTVNKDLCICEKGRM